MVTYPVHVKRKDYRGSKETERRKAAEHNRIARVLESHINGLIEGQEKEIQTYLYYEIASATGHPLELVRDMLFSLDGGHHGFTARKPPTEE